MDPMEPLEVQEWSVNPEPLENQVPQVSWDHGVRTELMVCQEVVVNQDKLVISENEVQQDREVCQENRENEDTRE